MFLAEEASVPKPQNKKPSKQKASKIQTQESNMRRVRELKRPPPTQTGFQASKRGLTNEVSPLYQPPEKSTSDSLPDSSTSGNEYRTLRRKYLLLEEESFGLGRELDGVEDEVKTLEQEKFALLDELVVLEGLVDRSEFQPQGQGLRLA
ncbi:hypothetical protein RJ639_034305 [Escallonia herrerae]|uniref:Uncharacterized protein n=1 Tax=Escallonia herrerae TaxID=1293975 RepID=A0AA88X1C0_9ASTE|nr:hypothetical protein RJ639_034305 [Escallonia herrerae]